MRAMAARLSLGWVLWCASAQAVEPPRFEAAAKQLQENTVTVRCIPVAKAAASRPNSDKVVEANGDATLLRGTPSPAVVRVCSGVSLGSGLIVTHADVSAAEIRITLPGGQQAQGQLRVFDRYSGLALLETDDRKLPGIPLASELPAVGGWVLTAAAWGSERSVVAAGILSAAERSLPGATYPPLLQCDVRTADTSCGAALLNEKGELAGIVVATDAAPAERGWAYAVPVAHVRRLQRTYAEAAKGQMVLLARLRPVVGLSLTPGRAPDEVVVQRVVSGGPAEKAGLRVGDRILAAEGVRIRSVYEAERPVLQKQPGDRLSLAVERGAEKLNFDITLGGGAEMPASFALNRGLFRPTLDVESLSPGRYLTRNSEGGVREVAIPSVKGNSSEPAAPPTAEEQIRLLEKAIDRYRSAVEFLQSELSQSQREQAEASEKLRKLAEEMDAMKAKLDSQRP